MYLAALSDLEGAPVLICPAFGHYQVGNGCILGFTGTVGYYGCVSCTVCHFDGIQGLGQGTDLVNLDQDGVGNLQIDALGQTLGVGYEQVVPYQLDLVT